MAFIRAGKASAVPPGTICELEVDGTMVAVANVEGKLSAFNNVCPHEGGPLGQGELEGKIVTCPWHGWQFDVCSGALAQSTATTIETYPVEVRGEDIYIDIG
jgi:nitrite reductase (NADH) small subunit